MKRLWDISRELSPVMPVWPGDRPFTHGWTSRMRDGADANVGHFAMSCHAGTHVDAPFHILETGATVDALPLTACLGPALVVPLARLADAHGEERVLLRADGGAPTVAALDDLARLRLLGTDAASVDPLDATALAVHHALRRRGVVILENLDLSAVPDGRYELLALPLRLAGMDGAPARAVLREL